MLEWYIFLCVCLVQEILPVLQIDAETRGVELSSLFQ